MPLGFIKSKITSSSPPESKEKKSVTLYACRQPIVTSALANYWPLAFTGSTRHRLSSALPCLPCLDEEHDQIGSRVAAVAAGGKMIAD